MSAYTEALQWLYGLESRGIRLGLDRMQAAVAHRKHPQRGPAFVHIAGSNGKGSVATFVASMLRAEGYRVGQFCSPHLHRFVERVQIEGRPISEKEAASRLQELRDDAGLPPLTFFEYATLLAFEAFRDAQCDVVALEVGLGGRLDATNVVRPAVSVISNISLEHQNVLGDTLGKIAKEKAGIFKRRVPALIGARAPQAQRAIRNHARRTNTPLRWIGRDFSAHEFGGRVDISVGRRTWEGLKLGLRGGHQIDNAAVAVAAVCALDRAGYGVSHDNVARGLHRARWPGRLEYLKGTPSFLFDAAHNADGCRRLAEYLDTLSADGPIVSLFGAMEGKDHRAMLAAFDGRVARRIYVTPSIRRAVPGADFARLRPGTVARSVRDGLARARRAAGPGGLVVVAGSIFAVAEIRALVKGVRSDPLIRL